MLATLLMKNVMTCACPSLMVPSLLLLLKVHLHDGKNFVVKEHNKYFTFFKLIAILAIA